MAPRQYVKSNPQADCRSYSANDFPDAGLAPRYRDLQKLTYIEALRGYAVLAVLVLHSSQAVAPTHPALSWITARGELGVQLFYLVSAITLCRSWHLRSAQETGPVRNFFIRRFFRIAPMFYVAIAYYTATHGLDPWFWAPNGKEWYFPLLTALFLHGFHPETINSVVPGGWSVAVEMTFYLLLPLLATRVRSKALAAAFLAFSVIVAYADHFAWVSLYSGLYSPQHQYLVRGSAYWSFPSQLPVFAMGILAESIIADRVLLLRFVAIGNAALIAILMLATGGVILALLPLQTVLKAASHYLVASAVLALAAMTLAYRPSKLVCNGFVRFLGKISFSVYLVQFAIIDLLANSGLQRLFLPNGLGFLPYFLCVGAATLAVSYLCYQYVETPGIAWGKRLIERLEQQDRARVAERASSSSVDAIETGSAAP